MTEHLAVTRLLPWTGAEGKPCYLSADSSSSYLSRLADNMEAVQLGLAADLLEEARTVLDGRKWSPGELHLLTAQLTEALTNVHRVARSRGARLTAPLRNGVDDVDDWGGLDVDRDASDLRGPQLPGETAG